MSDLQSAAFIISVHMMGKEWSWTTRLQRPHCTRQYP